MPRKVDYASRFHFFREAAFAIVRDRGVAALSRRALADELGISRNRVDDLLRAEADLRVLAADEVKSRRRHGRFNLTKGEPTEVAVRLVASLMPDAPARIDEELVWLRLMIEGPGACSPEEDPDGPLWARYQIAERGYVHTDRQPARLRSVDTADALADQRADREAAVETTLRRALVWLDLDEQMQDRELPRLRALVDGLTLAVCLGRVSPADGVQIARDHIIELSAHGPHREPQGAAGKGE
jgi:hypothetical protein